MKSIKQQYIDLREGKMSQHNFMRSLRMTLPQYITNITSFKDSVRILKNKGILNENMDELYTAPDPIEFAIKSYLNNNYSYVEAIKAVAAEEGMDEETLASQYPQDAVDTEGHEPVDEAYADEAPSYDYNGKKLYVDNQSGEPDAPGGKVSLYDEEENEYTGTISSIDGEGFISVDPESIQPANGENEDAEFIDMIAKAEDELSPNKYKFDDAGGLSEKAHDGLEIEWDWDNADVDYDTDEEGNEGAFGTVFGRDKEGHAYKARFDAPVSGGDADFDSANVSSIKKTEDASELYEGKKKKEPKKELHPNQIHPQELRMGIKVELEHTDSLDKAKKIALDHLAENPFYYTALKLSGIESPSAPKAKAPKAAKKEKSAEAELVDKVNAMKPVKGFEKAKASSNKAKKETNSGVKGVSELTHNAKSVRGLQKFAATGGKMKTIRENQLNEGGEWTITGTLTKDEQIDLKNMIGNYELDVQETDDTLETTISHPTYNDKTLEQALKQVRGMLPQKKQFGYTTGFGDVLQSKLEALVREVLDEMYDGRDDMNAQYAQDEIK